MGMFKEFVQSGEVVQGEIRGVILMFDNMLVS